MSVVDTSFLVALHYEDDEFHAEALRVGPKQGPFHLHEVVLAEFLALVFMLAGGVRRPKPAADAARRALRGILANSSFQVQAGLNPAEALRLYDANAALSYPDACAVALAWQKGEPLITYDRRQRHAFIGGSRGA